MGIDAFVLEGKGLSRRDMYTPIISISFFNRCWLPAIENLNLGWLRCLTSGIDLTKEDYPEFLKELQTIKDWAKTNYSEGDYDYIVESIEKLQNMLAEAFKHEDAIVFIG